MSAAMMFPVVTAAGAAVLSLIYAALSAWVIAGRLSMGVLHGDGGNAALNRRTRAHANFIEYVPLILLMAALLESGGGSQTLIEVLLVVLVVARLMHPFGMLAQVNSVQQYVCRGGAASATMVVLVATAVALLKRCIAG
jgi:uncharacterized membrane protein YecN with MAPEG domain